MRFQLAIPTIVFSAFSMAVNAGLNDDLIAYFPLNGNANDFIGTNNFVAYGGASLATDRQGRSDSAYFFDGVDDALVLTQGLIEARSSFSISVWFKPLQNDVLNQERTSGTFGYNQQYILGPSNHGDPVVGIGFSAGVNGISVFEHAHVHLPAVLVYEKDFGTNWVHAAITVESDGPPVLYINGVMVRTGLQSGRSKLYGQAVSTHQGFGGGGYGHFNGYIDEVRIYNRALSGIEIAELYHAESEIVISSFETNGEIHSTT